MQTLRHLLMPALVACCLASAHAATPIPLNFAQGSYCGTWRGNITGTGKTFSVVLEARQKFTIELLDGPDLKSVRGPGGKLTPVSISETGNQYEFLSKKKGKYLITVGIEAGPHFSTDAEMVEVCAY